MKTRMESKHMHSGMPDELLSAQRSAFLQRNRDYP